MATGSGSNNFQRIILADAGREDAFGGYAYRRGKRSTLEIIGVTALIIIFGITKLNQFIKERRALESHAKKRRKSESSFADSDNSGQPGPPPDISLWRKAASELSGTLTMPFDKSGMGLAITGMIDNHPFRINFSGKNKIFYSLTLPYAPTVEKRTVPIQCISDQAVIGENMIFLLHHGETPRSAVIKELAAYAKQNILTVPFEDEAEEDRPEAAFRRKQDIGPAETATLSGRTPAPIAPKKIPFSIDPDPFVLRRKSPEPVVPKPEPIAFKRPEPAAMPNKPEPVASEEKKEPIGLKPLSGTPEPEPAAVKEQEPPAPAVPPVKNEADELSPETLAGRLFSTTLPGPEEKKFFASLTGRRVEWTGTVRIAYDISSDFVFGRVKGVKVQMDLCTVAGKFGRQTLRGTAVFPPESAAALRASSNKTIRFRGTILKLESFSREVYLSEGELL